MNERPLFKQARHEEAFPEHALCSERSLNTNAECRRIDVAWILDDRVTCGCAQHRTRWKCRRLPDGIEGCKLAPAIHRNVPVPSWGVENYHRFVEGVAVDVDEMRRAVGCKELTCKGPASAQPKRNRLVVPPPISPGGIDTQQPWQGVIAKKPWQYRATAVIPHRNTPEHLELCLQFLARQTEPPYIMVIDTGSDAAALERVLALRSESVEVHQIACHATQDYADVVCFAMDLGMAACRAEYLWCLHSDCFVLNPNMLAELLAKSEGGKRPVIGYESVSAQKHDECKGMVSHTCTLLHMPTMHALDLTWSRARLASQAKAAGRTVVFDAEMALNYRLRDRGIEPMILGPEQAAGVERDANRVHLRSATLTAQVLSSVPHSRAAYEGVARNIAAMVDGCGASRNAGSEDRTAPTVFNLLYHVTPLATNDVWHRHIALLSRYMHVFNGRKIVAIAVGKHGDPIYPSERVEAELAGHSIEFIYINNDKNRRESASLAALLKEGYDPSTDAATFYAHTKGVTAALTKPVTMWYRYMYAACLCNIERVAMALCRISCCGAFRRVGPQPHFPDHSQWHFSGTFFWFRNDRLYSHPNWRDVDQHRYGAEAYPSKLFTREDSECLFCDDAGDLYDINYWNNTVIPRTHAEAIGT